MPGKPFQSKLNPYLEFIRDCRSKRWSYPQISKALRQEHQVYAAPSTIFSFVKARSKKRSFFTLPDVTQAKPSAELSMDAIARLKANKSTTQKTKPQFEFQEGEPLKFISQDKK